MTFYIPLRQVKANLIEDIYLKDDKNLQVEACVDVSEWYYRMFQKNLKLRTNVIVGTIPLRNYENPQDTISSPPDTLLSNDLNPPEVSYLDEDGPSIKKIEEANQSEILCKRCYLKTLCNSRFFANER